ncbi:MAG: HupE/UreJ family protein [Burkholderiales bacterium]|nr:HupE/UreJ family protein [Burkholderiales bacterium]
MNARRTIAGLMLWAIAAVFATLSLPAAAHKASDSFLSLEVKGRDVSGQWDIALRDIDFAIGLDADANGEITWGEVKARHDAIAAWALPRLNLRRAGGDCPLKVSEHLIDTHTDGTYAVLRFAGQCPAAGDTLGVEYRLLFDVDTLHRGLLKLDLDGVQHAAVLAPSTGALTFKSGETSRLKQFGHYIVEGVWHIWIGFDHILFLLSLLLPAVLVHEVVQRSRKWHGVARFGDAFKEVLWVVTAFTVAHSITLSLAALEIVSLPSRLVESAIAASVVLAALNNLWPVVDKRRWLVAFIFGLIHGFGFASVLADLGLPRDALVLSLLGFNIGVELGQLAIVAVFLPVAFVLRDTPFYRVIIFIGGSALTFLLALMWFVERAFDLKFFGG